MANEASRDFYLRKRRRLLQELADLERQHLPDKYAERQQASQLLEERQRETHRVLSTQAR